MGLSALEFSRLVEEFAAVAPNRALGGLRALGGFRFQVERYVADLVEQLRMGRPDGALLTQMEALSDIALPGEGHLVLVQCKRTLRGDTLRDAATELVAIDAFLETKLSAAERGG